MKHQLENKIGQVIVLYTKKGMQVGILEEVTEEGITLKELPKAEQKGIAAEHVFWGRGFFPWRGFVGGAALDFGLGFGTGFATGYGYPYGGYGYGYPSYGYYW